MLILYIALDQTSKAHINTILYAIFYTLVCLFFSFVFLLYHVQCLGYSLHNELVYHEDDWIVYSDDEEGVPISCLTNEWGDESQSVLVFHWCFTERCVGTDDYGKNKQKCVHACRKWPVCVFQDLRSPGVFVGGYLTQVNCINSCTRILTSLDCKTG